MTNSFLLTTYLSITENDSFPKFYIAMKRLKFLCYLAITSTSFLLNKKPAIKMGCSYRQKLNFLHSLMAFMKFRLRKLQRSFKFALFIVCGLKFLLLYVTFHFYFHNFEHVSPQKCNEKISWFKRLSFRFHEKM